MLKLLNHSIRKQAHGFSILENMVLLFHLLHPTQHCQDLPCWLC